MTEPPEPTGVARLLAPVRAGRLLLRNRVVMPAHTTNFARGGALSEQHLAYHRERAAGGVGLIITEGMRVHPTSLGRSNTLAAFDDRAAALGELVDVVHQEGALLAAQVLHVGRQAGGHSSLSAAWGASDTPWAGTASVPHVMTIDDIAAVVRGFGDAAARVEQAGVDAVELHLGHGHLLQQFLSPASNHRTDAYGGNLVNRLRITREVVEEVSARVSGDLPLILRVSADEFVEGGLELPDVLEALSTLLDDYVFDVLNVSHSAYLATGSVATQIADMSFPPQPFRHLPRAVKEAFPASCVAAVCRLDSLEDAAALVDDGDADLVALARPHIATPDLVHRARLRLVGEDPPRQDCIACNQGCTGRLELGLPISCVVNPEVGLEREWSALRAAPRARRRLLVVGGGPAGLHAAVAAAEAGHRVALREGAATLGGALATAALLPDRRRFALMVDQLVDRATRSGVEIETSRRVEAADVTGWDGVVLATGGEPVRDGRDERWSTTPVTAVVDELAAERGALGEHVVVVDEEGSWQTLSLVEALTAAGRRVTMVCAQAALWWRVPVYSKPIHLERLRGRGLVVRLLAEVTERDGSEVAGRDVVSGDSWHAHGVSDVVVVRPPRPRLTLVEALARLGIPHEVVGDAYAPRSALEAAFEGRRAGLTVASSDAAVQTAMMRLTGVL